MKSFHHDPFARDRAADVTASTEQVGRATPPGSPIPTSRGRALGLAIGSGIVALAVAGGGVAAVWFSRSGDDGSIAPTCVPGEPGCTPVDGGVVVTVQGWEFLGLDVIAEEFMEENPDVRVEVVIKEFQDHHDDVLDEMAFGNDGPTIVLVDDDYLPSFAERRDGLVNLLDYGAASLEQAVMPWRWNQGRTVDGSQVFGVPHDTHGLALCYRSDLLDAAGLPTDRDALAAATSTWEDFTALATTYTESTGKPFLDSTEMFSYALLQQEGPVGLFHDRDGALDLATARQAVELTIEYVEAGMVARDDLWSDEWLENIGADGYAAMFCPFWLLPTINDELPNPFEGQWDIALLPGGGGNWGGSHFVIPTYDDADERAGDIEKAYEFIEFALTEQARNAAHWEAGILPAAPGLSTDPNYTGWMLEGFNDALVAETFGAAAEAMPDEQFFFDGHTDISGAYWQLIFDIRVNGDDPEESWETFVEYAERVDRLS